MRISLNKITYILISLAIGLSFITRGFGEAVEGQKLSLLARFTPSELLGMIAVLLGVIKIIKGDKDIKGYKIIFSSAFLMCITFYIGTIFSYNIFATILETTILIYLICFSMLIVHVFKEKLFQKLIPLLSLTVLVASLIGFYDQFATSMGFYRIFPSRLTGEVYSGFRNAGQAGAYFLIMLTVLTPLYFSKLKYFLPKKKRRLLFFSVLSGVIFLFLTIKMASLIGFIIGVILYLIFQKRVKIIVTTVLIGTIIFINFDYLEKIDPTLYNRFKYKFETRITKMLDGTNKNTFFKDNWGGAIIAFKKSPIFGTGLDGFRKKYGKHEVHSTYLKLLAETGLVGTFGYLVFLMFFSKTVIKSNYNIANPYSDYLFKLLPFYIGCIISWSYTYHLRKREFWVLAAFLILINHYSNNYKKTLINKNVRG